MAQVRMGPHHGALRDSAGLSDARMGQESIAPGTGQHGEGWEEAPPTCVHGQHGLSLLHLSCELLLLGPGIVELGPGALEGGPHCGGGRLSTENFYPVAQPTLPSRPGRATADGDL